MKKKLLSLVCALALTVSLLPAAQALEGDGVRAARALASLSLVSGTGSGYDTDADATQEQAAALLVRLLGAEKAARADKRNCGWKEVPRWAWSAVNYCAYQSLIDWSEYLPNGALEAKLWCAMLLRALGYGEELGSDAARTALRIGLISRPLDGTLTRGDLFETALAALTYPKKDGGTLLDRTLSAVLCLKLYNSEKAVEKGNASANASAFLIRSDGLAVTNYHSIDGAVAGTATLATGEVCAIERVLYYDEGIDLAVLRIARTSEEGENIPRFHAIPLAGAREARVGDAVYAIGNPLGLGLALSEGVISSTTHETDLSARPCIVSDATISRGSSGGVLLNALGHAVAVTTGAYAYGNNMYLCVPVDPAMEAELSGEGMTLDEVREAVAAAHEAAEAEADEAGK